MTSPQELSIVAAVALPTIIPTLAVVISILRSDAKIDSLRTEVRADINSLRTEHRADTDTLRNDLRADVDALRNDLRADIRILTELGYEHHGRLTKLESKGQP